MGIRKEIASSLVLILCGAFFLLYDTRYPLDQWANPGPGVFPLLAGGIWVILAASEFIRAFRKTGSLTEEERSKEKIRFLREILQRNTGERKVLLMIAVFIIYLSMVKLVGFFTSTFLFVIVSSRLMGAKDWKGPVTLAAGTNLFCYLLFEVWLKLSFSRGILF
ncbi:MAG: tripartite tricarboxylate transporter TctB family protein [Syntrophaceae bacterium]|nr:tripartite tricarboxylate transporter TctB family protein [Syntrophaceae bacterium]